MTVKVTFDQPPIDAKITNASGKLSKEWLDWFTHLELLLNDLVQQINNP